MSYATISLDSSLLSSSTYSGAESDCSFWALWKASWNACSTSSSLPHPKGCSLWCSVLSAPSYKLVGESLASNQRMSAVSVQVSWYPLCARSSSSWWSLSLFSCDKYWLAKYRSDHHTYPLLYSESHREVGCLRAGERAMNNLSTFISLTDSLATFSSMWTSLRVRGMQCMGIFFPIQWSYDPCSCVAIPVASSRLKPSPLDQWPLKMKHSTGFSIITCLIPSILGLNVSVMICSFHT